MRLAVLALAFATGAAAADPLLVDGRVDHPLTLDGAALAKLPQTSVDASAQTAHGTVSGRYTGVLLWDLVNQAGIKPDPEKRKHHLQDIVLVTGSDGYMVAVAIGEIDPMFEGKQVLLGTGNGDKTLRLVVPGDKMAGRAVKDVVHIEVQ